MANFKTSIGGGNLLEISDLLGVSVLKITFLKSCERTGHPAKIAPMQLTFDNSQNDLNDMFDDYLMDIAADEITLTAEDNTQEKLYAAEDAVRAASKIFQFKYYYATNRGGTGAATRDVIVACGYLAGDSGNASTSNNTEISVPISIITAKPSAELTVAAASFDSSYVYTVTPVTIPTSGAGCYGKIVTLPLVNPA